MNFTQSALCATATAIGLALAATPALAAPKKQFGDPVPFADNMTFDPILDARIRWENVENAKDADEVSLRTRFGFEVKQTQYHIGFLAEAEGNLSLVRKFNAFPFPHPASQQFRPGYAVIPDPDNLELNRLQLQYKSKEVTLTVGRQRINLDDQRWVGSVAWRQNEQTFDAVRLEYSGKHFMFDGTYSNKQNTIFGNDAGPRRSFDGDFVFLQAGAKQGPVMAKGFVYLLGYGDPLAVNNSSQSYGVRVTGAFPIAKDLKLGLIGSYAHQRNYKTTPFKFAADYYLAEGALSSHGFTATAGYEKLGSDGGVRALQTPLATLHKFNGWADLFLTTPPKGLQDAYGSVAYSFPGVKAVKGLTAIVSYHQFDSAVGSINYGHEWNAQMTAKTGKVSWLAKFAQYTAKGFGADSRRIWLEADYSF